MEQQRECFFPTISLANFRKGIKPQNLCISHTPVVLVTDLNQRSEVMDRVEECTTTILIEKKKFLEYTRGIQHPPTATAYSNYNGLRLNSLPVWLWQPPYTI